MKKFEYKIIGIESGQMASEVEAKFNKYGNDGWEIISMQLSSARDHFNVLFKKEIEPAPDGKLTQ